MQVLLEATGRAFKQYKPLSITTRGFSNSGLPQNVPLDVHPEVLDALSSKKSVVALETTLVTHGFEYPTNVELATSLEQIVRSTGAVPATIGIVEGRIKIGLEKAELERLASPAKPGSVFKISRRDIAPAIAMKADGGTTCAATLVFAALAGIKVFATGGLGGVHRGGESTMDISADLQELTRCPVGLVSSGVKSILDIQRTLEYLETLGVPVLSYGPSREFPAFFSPRSGFEVPWNAASPSIAAKILHTQSQLRMQNGVLFAVPIPDKYEAAGAEIQLAVDQAVAESEANGISRQGKEATPWLLKRVSELSKGTSITSNIALLENTALIGGQIAVEYQKLAQEQPYSNITGTSNPSGWTPQSDSLPKLTRVENEKAKLVVLGAAAVDVTAKAFDASNSAIGSTVPGSISVSLGGKKQSVLLASPIGDDSFGNLLVKGTESLGMRTDGLLMQQGQRTAVCNMIMDREGNLTTGIADMAITEALAAREAIKIIMERKPEIVAMDGNSSPEVIATVTKWLKEQGVKVIKSTRILKAVEANLNHHISPIDFISPNLIELRELYVAAGEGPTDLMSRPSYWTALDSFSLGSQYRMDLEHLCRAKMSEDPSQGTLSFLLEQGVAQMAVKLLPFFRHIIVKCGEKGVLVVMRISIPTSKWNNEPSNIKARYIVSHSDSGETIVVSQFPALPVKSLINVTGAGDSLIGALLASLIQQSSAFESPETLFQIMDIAQRAAVLTLESQDAVSPRLSELQWRAS
ncbi:indigoidine synthase A-like protein [Rhodocollybia butyracea]|uniref:Indigoidine synthase A-like protein n=1 Tax=Rhodocollybia butyracea TaxID=206335 RepID=A0A9P5Q7T2_9AGAR|nr:indigoidine synthase A-like protein [Rhodocollybia butyracea]